VKSFGERFNKGPSYTTDTLYRTESTSRLTTTKSILKSENLTN